MLRAAQGRLAHCCHACKFLSHALLPTSLPKPNAKLADALSLTCLSLCTGPAISGGPAGGARQEGTVDVLDAAQVGIVVTVDMQA